MGTRGAWAQRTDARINESLNRAAAAGTLLLPDGPADSAALRRRCKAGSVIEPLRGMFVHIDHWESLSANAKLLHMLRGVQTKHPKWLFSHQTAASVHGLPVASSLLERIHVRLPRAAHMRAVQPFDFHAVNGPVETVLGIRVTPICRTVFDCASTLPFRDGLAIADAALRYHRIDRGDLICFVESNGKGKRGVRLARRVVRYADGRSESWGESAARALMIELGFALPELQVEIDLPPELGGPRRVDFLWVLPDGSYIIGEFDGMVKYRAPRVAQDDETLKALVGERQRESRLTVMRAPIVRFTFDDLRNPERFARLLDAFGVPRESCECAAA